MKNIRLFICVAAWMTAATICTAANWTDVTKNFIKNPCFDNNNIDGWTKDSSAETQDVRLNCISFNSGYFDLYQRIWSLPKGHYRLSVQGFYRITENRTSYENHKSGNEEITAFLYANDYDQQWNEQPLKCIFDEAMSSNFNKNCYTPDRTNYYPNSKEAALVAFEKGMYQNSMEFDAEGDLYIGVYSYSAWYDNYCVLDNFKLEYDGTLAPVTGIKPILNNTELVVGEEVEAAVKLQPEAAIMNWFDWTSSDEQVATVSYDGIIKAVGEGTATITATAIDGSGVKGTITITVGHNAATEGTLVVNEVMASNVDEYISPAFNYDGWLELYNPTDKTVEIGGLTISDPTNNETPWTMPTDMGVVPAKGYFVLWFDSHNICSHNVPFKLNIDGGTIVISNADGKELVRQDYPASMERISYARATDGVGQWGNTGTPTPGSSNNNIRHAETMLDAPVVDQPSQLFKGQLTINVTIPEGCTLRYTMDESLPTLRYGMTSEDGKFTITNTTNFRFRLYSDNMLPSRVTTRSYILKDEDYYLPIISIIGDYDALYGKDYGPLYSGTGPNGRAGNGQSSPRNYNMDWERPVNFSYLDSNGKMVFNQDVNLEVCGGWSRAWWPRPFKLKGNKELGGDKNLPYPFFDQKPYIRNRTLQIRNGGNDNNCRFKDPALQYMVQSSELNIDCQSYQPVHEFINGNYIGVLNMREPNNKHYVYANYGWDDDEIDQFEMSPDSGYVQKCGTPDAWLELVDVLSPNADNGDTYKEICRLLDIDSYINYMATQMYLANWDWPQNNVKGFRHRDDGRFRFILYDLDGAFSSNVGNPITTFINKEKYTFDQLYPSTLKRHVNEQIRFVTLFKNMMKNPDFCRRFVDAFCLIGGSVYQKDRAREIIIMLLNNVEPAMNINWDSSVSTANSIYNSLNTRLNTATNYLKNFAKLGVSKTTPQNVVLLSDTPGAKLYVNGLLVPTGSFDGRLFAPVTLKAEAPVGYRFKAWTDSDGNVASTDAEMSLPSGNNLTLTATFVALSDAEKQSQGITPVRINEVSGANDSFVDDYAKKGDWVELYNTTDKAIDVEGMFLSDDAENPTKCQITKGETHANTLIPAHGYLVVWCDKNRATTDRGLHVGFKIDADGGELLLTASDRSWADHFQYGRHDARTTVGRYPDGTSDVYLMDIATIGHGNRISSYTVKDNASGSGTGVRPSVQDSDLRLCYASQFLLVRSSGNRPVDVSICRADGVPVRQATLAAVEGKARLDIGVLQPGVYVAKATDSNGSSITCKFVKQ